LAERQVFCQRRDLLAALGDRLNALVARIDALLASPSPDPKAVEAAAAEL